MNAVASFSCLALSLSTMLFSGSLTEKSLHAPRVLEDLSVGCDYVIMSDEAALGAADDIIDELRDVLPEEYGDLADPELLAEKISLEDIANVYELVVEAGVHRAESIKVAEAAKVIENSQRDINIAFMKRFYLHAKKEYLQ